jgi:hypothetical protein
MAALPVAAAGLLNPAADQFDGVHGRCEALSSAGMPAVDVSRRKDLRLCTAPPIAMDPVTMNVDASVCELADASSNNVERSRGALFRHRKAVEIKDSLVQGMAAAKWSIEAVRMETGLEMLTESLDRGHRLVSQLIRE